MQKGISRQIVEVTHTDNPYFERAFLVVRSDYTDCPPDHLDREASRFLKKQGAYTGMRQARQTQLLQRLTFLLVGGGAGALIALVLNMIL